MSRAIPVQISTGRKIRSNLYIQIKNGNVYKFKTQVPEYKAQVFMNNIMAARSVALKYWTRVR
jgi:hypothetical protein